MKRSRDAKPHLTSTILFALAEPSRPLSSPLDLPNIVAFAWNNSVSDRYTLWASHKSSPKARTANIPANSASFQIPVWYNAGECRKRNPLGGPLPLPPVWPNSYQLTTPTWTGQTKSEVHMFAGVGVGVVASLGGLILTSGCWGPSCSCPLVEGVPRGAPITLPVEELKW